MTDTEILDAITQFKGSVRLSNKAAQGYWWCYLTCLEEPLIGKDWEVVVQATSPREAIVSALKQLEEKRANDNGSQAL